MTLSDALGVRAGDLVALVGAGGKTRALRRLGVERAAAGERVLLSTTTKIEPQPGLRTVFVRGPAELEALAGPWPVLAVTEALGARLRGVPPAWLDAAAAAGLRVIAQADGAARRPFKAPGDAEPVIPFAATLVVSVVGLDVLGAPLSAERVHRPERVSALTGSPLGATVTIEVVAAVLLHADGGGRGVPAGARRMALLNKADDTARRAAAQALAEKLAAGGLPAVASCLASDPVWIERL